MDELDRCRPTYSVELLERIKHLFDMDEIIFILSTDINQLSHSVSAICNDFNGKKYLERFIDLKYKLRVPNSNGYA
ncbi:MAG: P-loop NTPase fold protein [Thiolinea sp.]